MAIVFRVGQFFSLDVYAFGLASCAASVYTLAIRSFARFAVDCFVYSTYQPTLNIVHERRCAASDPGVSKGAESAVGWLPALDA